MIETNLALLFIAVSFMAIGYFIKKSGMPLKKKLFVFYCSLSFSVFPLSLSFYIFTFYFNGSDDEQFSLFNGVVYSRDFQVMSDQNVVIHRVSMLANNVSLGLSQPILIDGRVKNLAMKTSSALELYNADLAINGSFFLPFREKHILDYFPHSGDSVSPVGQTVWNGVQYGRHNAEWPKFVVSYDGKLMIIDGSFEENNLKAQDFKLVVSGKSRLIKQGILSVEESSKFYPRTAVGLNSDATTLWFFVVDGKQPFYSNGISKKQLGKYMLSLGVYDAIELDGGGSSTLVWKNLDDEAELLNRPIHTKIPMRERPVANHILVHFN